jgi:hypothetical protein
VTVTPPTSSELALPAPITAIVLPNAMIKRSLFAIPWPGHKSALLRIPLNHKRPGGAPVELASQPVDSRSCAALSSSAGLIEPVNTAR